MSLKRIKVISVFGMFALCFLTHFLYNWLPNSLFSIFFPVNESIWEHNKIIILSTLSLAIIEKIYYKKRKNVLFAEATSSLLCMFLVMIIFTPIYLYFLKTRDNIIITFIIYFLSISISQILSYYLLLKSYQERLEELGIILFSIFILTNIVFTYYPPRYAIFYDFVHKIYGLP